MYRPKKETILPLLVANLEALPSEKDVFALLHKSQDNLDRGVQVSWQKPGATSRFLLTATSSRGGGEPVWVLSEAQDRHNVKEHWTYPSGDVALILNLCLAESTGQDPMAVESTPFKATATSANMASAYSTSLLGLQASTSARIKIVESVKSAKVATMEGDLADMTIPTLLQSMSMGKKTGRLFIDNGDAGAELFFENGEFVHAKAMDVTGDQAILELVTWERGKFYFYRDEKTSYRTINKRVDVLLVEGVTLLDQTTSLIKAGVTMECYLNKKNPNLSEQDFERQISQGAPCDIAAQKQFYLLLDGITPLFDHLRRRPMVKTEWVPIVFNLINCGLTTVSQKPISASRASYLEPTAIDKAAISKVMQPLYRPDSGILCYPAFQYFLHQEFLRYQRYGTPFSIIIFEMWTWDNKQLLPLPPQVLKEAIRRIDIAKRDLDILAHFETFSYSLLLPGTDPGGAAMLAHRIMEMLRSKLPENDDQTIVREIPSPALAFGISAIPDDCADVGLLLSAAKTSKLMAQSNAYPIVMFKDLQAPAST